MLGSARKQLAQLWILSRHADRAGIEVANPHHDAAHRYQGGSGKSKFLRAKQRRDYHIPAGFQLAVGFHNDSRAKIV